MSDVFTPEARKEMKEPHLGQDTTEAPQAHGETGTNGQQSCTPASKYPPGCRSRISKALFRELRSCCRWLVRSKQYFKSSTAGLDSGKSEDQKTGEGSSFRGEYHASTA